MPDTALCPSCNQPTDVQESNTCFLGRNSQNLSFFKCSHCGAIFPLKDGVVRLAHRTESGKRFVPITTGLFFMGVALAIFVMWGSNIVTLVLGGLIAFYGWTCLKIGIFGSKQLIDEMTLDTAANQSQKAQEEWEQIFRKKL